MEIFKISKQELSRWHQKGCPKLSRGVFSFPLVVEWWALNIYEARLEREGIDESLKTARQKYWKAKAEREEINVSLTKGELIPKKILEEIWGDRVVETRQGLLNLENRLPPILVSKTQAEIQEIVHKEVVHLLNMYSRDGKYTPRSKITSKTKPKRKIAKRKTKKK
jgi:phage terminase Nu1 subunit (DNA packaging protein)